MNRRQQNLLYEMRSVAQFFEEHAAMMDEKPPIRDVVTQLQVMIQNAEELQHLQKQQSQPETSSKAKERDELTQAAIKVRLGLVAHAAAVNDVRLQNMFSPSRNVPKRLSENDLLLVCSRIHTEALPLLPQLKVWNVTPDDLELLQRLMESFHSKTPLIRSLKAKSSQATTDIKSVMDGANKLLTERLDALMLPVQLENPSLYGEYLKTRKVIQLRTGKVLKKPSTESSTERSPT